MLRKGLSTLTVVTCKSALYVDIVWLDDVKKCRLRCQCFSVTEINTLLFQKSSKIVFLDFNQCDMYILKQVCFN